MSSSWWTISSLASPWACSGTHPSAARRVIASLSSSRLDIRKSLRTTLCTARTHVSTLMTRSPRPRLTADAEPHDGAGAEWVAVHVGGVEHVLGVHDDPVQARREVGGGSELGS